MNSPIMLKTGILTLAIILAYPEDIGAAQRITAGFSSRYDDSAFELVLNAINDAKSSIDVAAYKFASLPIAKALVSAQNRGVIVRVVADAQINKDKYTALSYMANRGVTVRLNGNYESMHNKFMVVDSETVQTGSFDYTAKAIIRNAENVLMVQSAPELANIFLSEFNRLWNESEEQVSINSPIWDTGKIP